MNTKRIIAAVLLSAISVGGVAYADTASLSGTFSGTVWQNHIDLDGDGSPA